MSLARYKNVNKGVIHLSVCLYSSSVRVSRVNSIQEELWGFQLLLLKHKSPSLRHICEQHLARFKPTTKQKQSYLFGKPLFAGIINMKGAGRAGWLGNNGKRWGLCGGAGFCRRPAASHLACMVLSVSPRLRSWCAEAQCRQTDGPFWKRATAQWCVCGVPPEPPRTNTISVCWERTGT